MASIELADDRTTAEIEEEQTLICVGKFDPCGLPNITSRHLSQQATVTFQTITLAQMLQELVKNEPLVKAHIYHADGTKIRIDHSAEGFVAYLAKMDK